MKKSILSITALLFLGSAVAASGLHFGLISAVKSQVSELDKKVRDRKAEVAAAKTNSVTIAGRVAKGAVSGATVKFFALNADGTKGAALGTATTDSNGNYSGTASLTSASGQIILAEASGGSYHNEVSGLTESLSGTDVLTAVLPSGTTQSAITPLTHMAASRARPLAASGVALATAVNAANAGVAQQYSQQDILGILPVDAGNATMIATSSREQRVYGLVLAGLAQEAATLNVRPMALSAALATDMDDGVLDGLGAAPVQIMTIAGPVVNLPADAGLAKLQNALTIFLGSGSNVTNLAGLDISITPVNINPAGGKFYIAATCLPAWHEGQSGSAALTARGGDEPYSWKVTAGSSLPSWMSLSNGVLSGTPPLLAPGSTMSISPAFSLTCTDATGLSQAVSLTVTVLRAPPALVPVAGISLTVGQAANVKVGTVSGGASPYYYTASGAPPGTSVGLDGYLTGTPTASGTYLMRVCVVDLVGAEDFQDVAVTVSPAAVNTGTGTYAGTWLGTFHYTAKWFPAPDYTEHDATVSFTLTITMATKLSVPGSEMLTVTSAKCSDARFGATAFVTPDSSQSTAALSTVFGSTSQAGEGISVTFPNGSTIFTKNSAGELAISADGRTISNTAAVAGSAFSASTGVGDANATTSGPGSYAYNWCTFASWTFVKQ